MIERCGSITNIKNGFDAPRYERPFSPVASKKCHRLSIQVLDLKVSRY